MDGYLGIGWCRKCNALRDTEQPLNAQALRTQITKIAPKPTLGGFFKGAVDRALGGSKEDTQAELRQLLSLLRLAEQRRSGSRCLTCGATAIIPLVFEEDGSCSSFAHECGSQLYRLPTDPNAPRFSYRPEIIPLDSEGNRLDKAADYYQEFYEFMVEKWQIKDEYVKAFLTAYRKDLSLLHDAGLDRLDASFDLSKPENRLLVHQMPDPREFALVGQAYAAYNSDIKQGKKRGTPIETAIWAILWNRSDLLASIDPTLANYIEENQNTVFKAIYETAFKD